jgi:hypothetical protein
MANVCRFTLLSALMVATSARAAPSDSGSAYERMFAASPQRELKREWDTCIAAIATGVVANGKTVEDFKGYAFPLCADQESKLTGWMVREFGFQRGNAAVKWAKQKAIANTREAIAARNRSEHPSNLFEITDAGWRVLKVGSGSCVALLADGTPFMQATVVLQRSTGRDRMLFVEGMTAQEVDAAVPQPVQVKVDWSASSQTIAPKQGVAVADAVTSKTGLLIQLMIDSSLQPLDQFTVVEFELPAESRAGIFHIAGMSAAWERVKVCAAQA